MRGDKKLEHLRRVHLFSACSDRELGQLGRATDEIDVPAGKVLCEQGSIGHEFFLILSGTAAVEKGGEQVATLGAGASFGELALLDHGPRTATVRALDPMRVVVLGQREFAAVLDEVPGIAHKLLKSLAMRLRDADEHAVH